MARNQRRIAVPTLDDSRREFGVPRTVCSCEVCQANCRFLPGYLIPGDLARLLPATEDPAAQRRWAEQHLRASAGAVVARRMPGQDRPQYLRIPTLVPARASVGGPCGFLTDRGRCAIHAVSPFGCAFHDHAMSREVSDELSRRGLLEIAKDFTEEGPYSQMWLHLQALGLTAEDAVQARQKLQQWLLQRDRARQWWKKKSKGGMS